MHYKLFGKSGLRVSELALGTMTFGNKNGDGVADKIVSRKLFDAFLKAGGNFMLWVHMWDSVTLIEEVMRGLDALIRSGKVLYIGVSDYPAWVVSQANTLAELRNCTPFVALQIEYSLIQRTPERELLPMAQGFGLTITPWSVLGAGLLTG